MNLHVPPQHSIHTDKAVEYSESEEDEWKQSSGGSPKVKASLNQSLNLVNFLDGLVD